MFEGEAGEDAGGPFRSSLMFVCDDLISNGFDVGPPTEQPVVEGFGGTNWGAHGRAMSPSVGERPRLEGETHRIPKL